MPSIKDVAREAGVSTATVSRMMANKGYVGESTRAQVQAAVDKLGYRPNRVAQRLRDQKSRIIALVVSDIQNPFFGKLCRAVETFVRRRGYCVFICNTDEDPAIELDYLEIMEQEHVAGIILSPSSKRAANLKYLKGTNIPVVTVDRRTDTRFDAVLLDNKAAARALAERVIAGGYKRIAGIFGADSFTAGERLAGFETALADAGQTPHQLVRIPAFEAEGQRAMETLLAATTPPDAVICSSALIATGAYRAIHAAGIRIPQAIGFACFDDPSWANLVAPGVTVIEQPAQMMGESAAELLLKRIEDSKRSPSELRLQGRLIERGSLR
jgi:LacI family fructose operon transcriptional repressor